MKYDIFRDTSLWKKYIEQNVSVHSDNKTIFRNSSWQVFDLLVPSGMAQIKSMLTIFEIATLFAASKDYYSGEGEIVDLGALTGLSTNALAQGLKLNSIGNNFKRKRIYSYDLFLTRPYYEEYAIQDESKTCGSLFNEYIEINKDFLDNICPCPGDLLKLPWQDKLIEILFIDIAKSWELNNFVIEHFFPSLIPGKSLVLHQDYVHFNEYWIHITMEYLSEYFDLLFMIYGATAVYGLKKDIPPDLCKMDLSILPIEHKTVLLQRAIDKAPPSAKEVLKSSLAKCLYDHKHFSESIATLQTVSWTPLTDDPAYDFSAIAYSNAQAVNNLLKNACGESAF